MPVLGFQIRISKRQVCVVFCVALGSLPVAAQVPQAPRQQATPWTRTGRISIPRVPAAVPRPLSQQSWTPIGPAALATGSTDDKWHFVAGRVTGIAAHPTDASTIYLAFGGGGVWKTTNAGGSWTPLTDSQKTMSMGAIAIAPSNPSVIYAGTGEANGALDSHFGWGILISSDAGATWRLSAGPGERFSQLSTAQIAVHPTNADIAYAAMTTPGLYGLENAVQTGVWKTSDRGVTWTNVSPVAGQPATSVAIDPTNPQNLYAAIHSVSSTVASGIYKSTNGGQSWSLLSNAPKSAPGNPDSIGRMTIALAPSNPNVLYAMVTDPSNSGLLAFVRSDDGGSSFTTLTNTPNFLVGQGWYNQAMAVSPTDSATVYVAGQFGGNSILRSTNSGVDWTDISTGRGDNQTSPHADHHAMAFDGSGKLLDGNDGGLFRLDDPLKPAWVDLNSNLNTILFQSVGIHPDNPNIIIGGSQDNGVELYTGNLNWILTDGGDGGYAKFSPTDGTRAYHQLPYLSGGSGFFRRSDDGGVTWASKTSGITDGKNAQLFYAPFAVDPGNGNRVLYGANSLWETTDGGETWKAIATPGKAGFTGTGLINSIAVAATDPKTVYCASPFTVWVTRDDGATWTKRPLPLDGSQSSAGYLRDVQVDATAAGTVWAISGYFKARIWRSLDAGVTWNEYTGNLPSIPAFSMALDPDTGQIYLGMDDGVYVNRSANSDSWDRLGTGMPNVAVYQLEYSRKFHVLAAATHGRGAWLISTAPGFSLTPSATDLGYPATTVTFDISAQDTWFLTPPNASWVHYSGPRSANGNATISFTIDGNPTASSRSATFTVEIGSQRRTFTVTQGPAPVVSLPFRSTGVTAAGAVAASGSADSYYVLVSRADGVSGNAAYLTALVSGWVANDGSSAWIAPSAGQNPGSAAGSYTYRTLIDLTGYDAATAVVSGQWAAADNGVIVLNGAQTTNRTGTSGWQQLVPFTLTGFQAGLNIVDFVVPNANGGSGLRVRVDSATANSKTSAPLLFSTGTGNEGETDPHYELIARADGVQSADPAIPQANAVPSWLQNDGRSKWISPSLTPQNGSAEGDYVYRTTLDLTGYDAKTVVVKGQYAADNRAVMQLNGKEVPGSASTRFDLFTPFQISGGFQAGVNNIDFVVNNAPGGASPTGLRVLIDSVDVTSVPPDLTVELALVGQLVRGGQSSYDVTVSNRGGVPTSAPVSVSVTLPAGLSASSVSGSGWTCSSTNCSRADQLAPGKSYAPVTVRVTVGIGTASPALTQASAASSDDANANNNTASLSSPVSDGPADLTVTARNAEFSQSQTGATYNVSVSNVGIGPSKGTVTITQSLPAGLTATSLSGTGWTCDPLPALSCSRNDSIGAQSAYPDLVLVVSVAKNAAPSLTNHIVVSGGGETNTANNVFDAITVVRGSPDLTIKKTHTADFLLAQTDAAYTLVVKNEGTASTSGAVTVNDNLPGGLTAVAFGGSGWSCQPLPALNCSRVDPLPAGSSYPPITLTAKVTAAGPAQITNRASVSGGGEFDTTNNSAEDPTSIVPNPAGTLLPIGGSVTATGPAPSGVAIADFDGDGIPDIATVNQNDSSVSILPNRAGRYVAAGGGVLRAGNGPAGMAIAAGDLNGDGRPDIVVSNQTTGRLLVFLGAANGSFTAAPGSPYTVGNSGQVLIADFNNDGKPDLAVAADDDVVAILLGDGAGRFSPPAGYPGLGSGETAFSISAADFNGDGKTDLAVIAEGLIYVYLNDGSGKFTASRTSPTNTGTLVLNATAGDLNGDGKPDLLFTDLADRAGVMLGRGDGSLQPPAYFEMVSPTAGPATVNFGDYDGDSKPDVAILSGLDSASALQVYIGNGDGTFRAPVTFQAGGRSVGMATGDLNQDGRQDIVVSNFGDGNVRTYLGARTPVRLTLVPPIPSVVTYGSGVRTTATVTALAPSFVPVSGPVDFLDNGTRLGRAPLSNGSANIDLPQLTLGARVLSVAFGGDARLGSDSVSANLTVALPAWTVTKAATSVFVAGATGSYLITVTNSGQAATTSRVDLTDLLPPSLSATSITGQGWTCTLATVSCYRSDPLAAGLSYPPVVLAVNIAPNAPVTVANQVTVSGGVSLTPPGMPQPSATASVNTTVTMAPSWVITKTHRGTFAQGQPAASFTISVANGGGLATRGQVNVQDTVPSGLTLLSMSGTGWSCSGSNCSRSDPLNPSASYPSITATFSVATNAPTSVANQATVTGGGANSQSITDTATVNAGSAGFVAASASPLVVGTHPVAAVSADFDRDGKPDFAVVNGVSMDVSVFLGDGAGRFRAAPSSPRPGGTTPVAILTGDFDGDGNPDLIVVDISASGSFTVLLGRGNGDFTTGATIPAGNFPTAATLVDVNGDGKPDLAIVNNNGVITFAGDGRGGFSQALSIPFNGNSDQSGIVAADFNGDGKADLAVTNSGDNSVSVFLGDGAGGFPRTVVVPVPSGNRPWGIAAGDFNRDAKMDLVVVNTLGNSVSTMLGDGAGGFQPGTVRVTGRSPSGVMVTDLNGDGNPDLVVSNQAQDSLSIYIGAGDGTFSGAPGVFPTGSAPNGLVAADFNLDGRPDIAVMNSHADTATILLGTAPAATRTTLTLAPGDTVPSGQAVALTASVNPGMGFFAPTGQVRFKDGNVSLGTAPVVNGTASFTASGLAAGRHSLTAEYLGDSRTATSTSPVVDLTVTQ